jgi:hypothetical protein
MKPHERYTKAPIIKVTNSETNTSAEINLYDLIHGLQNPLNDIKWASLYFDFKGGLLEFDVINKSLLEEREKDITEAERIIKDRKSFLQYLRCKFNFDLKVEYQDYLKQKA